MTFFLFASLNGEKISINLYFCKRNCRDFRSASTESHNQLVIDSDSLIQPRNKKQHKTLFFHRSSSQSPKIPLEVLLKFLSQQIFRSISFPFHASVSVPKCFNKENNWCKMKVSELIVFRDRLLSNCVWLHPLTRPAFCRVFISNSDARNWFARLVNEILYFLYLLHRTIRDRCCGSLCKKW